MKTIKPVLGTLAGVACLAIWTSVSVSDYLAADETKPVQTADAENSSVESLIKSLAEDVPAPSQEDALKSVAAEITLLSQAYNSGEITCQDCLEKVDLYLAQLESGLGDAKPTAVWQESHEELIEIRNDLPCGGTVISEEIVTEVIDGPCPVPMAPALAPIPEPAPVLIGGGGGGGGGGFSFLPLAGIGVGAAVLLNDDDDNRVRRPATPIR